MKKTDINDLQISPRASGYARGRKGHEQILQSALDILIEEGFASLSLRNVARRCEMNVGNVSYYFSAKEDLIQELFNAIISPYETAFDVILNNTHINAEQKLEEVCGLIMDDLGTRKTSFFFPELWNLSNRDSFAKERMIELYARARVILERIIDDMRPDLSRTDRDDLAVFVQASMEGHTIFIGFERQFGDRADNLISIARQSFAHIIQNYKK